jgi:microcystin-dependent protein
MPPGLVSPYAGATGSVPSGWLLCNGQAVSRTAYSALYAIVGTAYGSGDGSTTFNVPNLKGRVPVGLDDTQTEFDTRGETGGSKTHTLTTAQLPSHSHTIPAHKHDINRATTQAASGTGGGYEVDGAGATAYTETENAPADTTGNTGGGDPHNILQPYLVLNYIIKT